VANTDNPLRNLIIHAVLHNELTKKDHPFVWEGPQQHTFELLKAWVHDNVVLTIPVDGAPF
jgi:hypothetical protein